MDIIKDFEEFDNLSVIKMSDISQVPQGNNIYTGMDAITDFRGHPQSNLSAQIILKSKANYAVTINCVGTIYCV